MSDRSKPTNSNVARWMLDYVQTNGELEQETAAYTISEEFGEAFTYENENGNLAISRDVLKEFGKISEETVVWDRGYKSWRMRSPGDSEGRSQD